eukprot:1457973-Rhodomonas_salina.2
MNLALSRNTAMSLRTVAVACSCAIMTQPASCSTTQAYTTLSRHARTEDVSDGLRLKSCLVSVVSSRRCSVDTSSGGSRAVIATHCTASAESRSAAVVSQGERYCALCASSAAAHVTPSDAFTRSTTAINWVGCIFAGNI